MLRGLDISDMLIIDRLELAFQPGLNVLTGETGAVSYTHLTLPTIYSV